MAMSVENGRFDSSSYRQSMAEKLKDLSVLIPTNVTLLRGALGAQHRVPGSSSISLEDQQA